MNPIKTISPTECIIASLFGSNFFPLIASIPNINGETLNIDVEVVNK